MKNIRISIVTPSYQQANFLEQTLCSVLEQNYDNLEYIVIDGGSTDGSCNIIKHYSNQLEYWCSEPDAGHYSAINKGFSHATGEVMAWLNSDDMYFPWTFRVVNEIFQKFPEVEWISSLLPALWSRQNIPCRLTRRNGFSASFFSKGLYLGGLYPGGLFIQQESTFWRRSLWERAGSSLSETLSLAGDFELWHRFFNQTSLVGLEVPLGGFRKHGDQRSVKHLRQYLDEALSVLTANGLQLESGAWRWMRRKGWGKRWPLRIMPSLGLIQPVKNIRWSWQNEQWDKITEWIDK